MELLYVQIIVSDLRSLVLHCSNFYTEEMIK